MEEYEEEEAAPAKKPAFGFFGFGRKEVEVEEEVRDGCCWPAVTWRLLGRGAGMSLQAAWDLAGLRSGCTGSSRQSVHKCMGGGAPAGASHQRLPHLVPAAHCGSRCAA